MGRKANGKSAQRNEYIKEWSEAKSAGRAENHAGPSGAGGGAPGGGGGEDPRLTPRLLPGRETPQSFLKPLCPPGGYIWLGRKGLYASHFKPFPRYSMTLAAVGMRQAAIMNLQDLWKKWALVNGKTIRDCPIACLFPDESQ